MLADAKNSGDLTYFCGVSWPRSGHHLLVRVLAAYFGERFRYCEYYKPSNCCKSVPCDRAGEISLSKNHDRELAVPILAGGRYLVQYREFCPSVVSDFELYLRNKKKDSARNFRKFAEKQAKMYTRFMERWAAARAADATFARISYERLTASPAETMEIVVRLFAPEEPLDRERLQSCIESVERITVQDGVEQPEAERGVSPGRDICTFRHYDETFFRHLDRWTRPEYERMAALPVVEQSCDRETSSKADHAGARPNQAVPSGGMIYVDATGLLSQRGIAPTGIPRVHAFLVQQAINDPDPSVQTIVFDPAIRAYRHLTDRETPQLSSVGPADFGQRKSPRHQDGSFRAALEIIRESPNLGRDFDRYFAARISKRRPDDPRFVMAKVAIRSYRSFRRLYNRGLATNDSQDLQPKNGVVLMSQKALFGSPFSNAMSATERRTFVCHDLIPWLHPEFASDGRQAKRFVARLKLIVKSGALALCTSQTSHAMLSNFAAEVGIATTRIARFPLPSMLFELATSYGQVSRLTPEQPFVLCCSTIEVRKNHLLLAKIWKRALDEGITLPKLVCAGKWGWGVQDLQDYLRDRPDLADCIEFLGPVSDRELIDLYRGALFGVLPSRIEGWGLSASECLDFGIPVIVSTAPALQEATHGLMPSIDPDDESAWYAQIRRLAEHESARVALEEKIAGQYRRVTPKQSWEAIKSTLRASA